MADEKNVASTRNEEDQPLSKEQLTQKLKQTRDPNAAGRIREQIFVLDNPPESVFPQLKSAVDNKNASQLKELLQKFQAAPEVFEEAYNQDKDSFDQQFNLILQSRELCVAFFHGLLPSTNVVARLGNLARAIGAGRMTRVDTGKVVDKQFNFVSRLLESVFKSSQVTKEMHYELKSTKAMVDLLQGPWSMEQREELCMILFSDIKDTNFVIEGHSDLANYAQAQNGSFGIVIEALRPYPKILKDLLLEANKDDVSPLHIAATSEMHEDVVAVKKIIDFARHDKDFLLKLLTTPNIDGVNSFHILCSYQDDNAVDVLKIFSDNDETLMQLLNTPEGNNNRTAFHFACMPSPKVVEFVLDRFSHQNYELLDRLMEQEDEQESSSLFFACVFSEEIALKIVNAYSGRLDKLLELVTNMSRTDYDDGDVIYHSVFTKAANHNPVVARRILSRFCHDESAIRTILFKKHGNQHIEFANVTQNYESTIATLEVMDRFPGMLLEALQVADSDNTTAFMQISANEYCRDGAVAVINKLAMDKEALKTIFSSQDNDNNTALSIALDQESPRVATRYIEIARTVPGLLQTMVSAQNKEGETPLMHIIQKHRELAIKTIEALGEQAQEFLEIEDDEGKNSYDWAKEHDTEIYNYIQSRFPDTRVFRTGSDSTNSSTSSISGMDSDYKRLYTPAPSRPNRGDS